MKGRRAEGGTEARKERVGTAKEEKTEEECQEGSLRIRKG